MTAFLAMISLLKWATFGYLSTFGYSAYAVFYFCFLLSVLLLPNPMTKRVLNNASLRWLGTTSYCIYLAHEGVPYTLFGALGREPVIRDLSSFTVTLAAVAVTYAIAQATWVLIERPLTRRAHAEYKY